MSKSPVQLFYDNIEKRKREELLVQDNKPKRGRPRKNKLYFTSDTESLHIIKKMIILFVIKYITNTYIML